MKVAIHLEQDKPDSWNKRWTKLCKERGIDYINVDSYSPDLIDIIKREGVTHYMWSFSLMLPKDELVAKSILNAVNQVVTPMGGGKNLS